ncbi:MAG: AAA family ATPase [Verrucomicrobiota bacterium]
MKNQIANYIRAGYSGLYIVSHEEQRVGSEISAVVDALNKGANRKAEHKEHFDLYVWSITEGIQKLDGKDVEAIKETEDPFAMLGAFSTLPEKSILLLRDFHMILADPNPVVFRKVKDAIALGKSSNRVIVIIGCQLKLPPELEKEITVLEYRLPDREQLLSIANRIADENELTLNGNTDQILDAAGGLTTIEAENAFALSIVEKKDITPEVVAREKSNTVRKNGLLEIIDLKLTLDDIGGLENLKADLYSMRNLFTKEAREYGLPTPRGKLLVGQAGTGKSLCAQACGTIFGIPLVKLEAGRIFGSLVGESERNWRTAFSTAKAISPCVLWIDEVDGLFSGGESSGKTDGGTTQRVIKAILQDMQFNSDGIFFVFTANDIDGLPDPLIDRLDVWSVELPNKTEREAIWSIHIAKRKRKASKFDLAALADATEGFSGRQIEQIWLKAMTNAFNAGREPSENDAIKVAKASTATSVTMADAIKRRRERLEGRATPASAPEKTTATGGRKLVK